MKALVFQLASLTDVTWQMSGEVVLMSLIGGMGTVFGALVGAAVVVSIQNYFAEVCTGAIRFPENDVFFRIPPIMELNGLLSAAARVAANKESERLFDHFVGQR